jgi:phosphoserine aminotransferase
MFTDRIHNFNAGPGVLPEPVLRQAQQDLWNIAGSGIGIAEHSHRGKLFERVIAEAEADARALAGIPDSYKILFIQGGASQQFAMVPMNLLSPGRRRTTSSRASGRRRRWKRPGSSATRTWR